MLFVPITFKLPQVLSRAELKQIKSDAFNLALDIGVRPAARAMGLSESRVMKWSERDNWQIGRIRPNATNAQKSASVSNANDAKRRIIAQCSDRTAVGFALTAVKVSEHLADQTPEAFVKPALAISAEQYSRVSDRTFGWSASRQQTPTVQIANIVLPSAEERAKLDAIDRKLDAFVGKYLKRGSTAP